MRRRQMKKQKQIIIISSLCLLLCLCVGYAAFQTQLSIRAKGNIKELPGIEMGGLKVNTVTEGDGLYADEYEDGRYIYKGANPDNYITFNGETAGWRIISVEADGSIKITKDAETYMEGGALVVGQWNVMAPIVPGEPVEVTVLNDWTSAKLNTSLNETYLTGLSSAAQGQIISHDWSIGAVTDGNNDMSDQINDENSSKWNGKIALPTVSEYIRTNSNTSQCGTFSLYKSNSSTCKNSTWMYKLNIENSAVDWWTLSPYAGNSRSVFYVNLTYSISYGAVTQSNVACPTLYLNSNLILSGSGTQEDPYTIVS